MVRNVILREGAQAMSEKDRPKPPQTGATPEADEAADARTAEPTEVSATGSDIEAAVRGQDFPAGPKDLMDRARQNGAEEFVLQRLSELPDRRYSSLGDALRALDMLS